VAQDHVLFSPAKMNAVAKTGLLPRYGALANRSLDEMIAGARVDVAPYKRDPMDFVLWKPSKPGEPAWPSPVGIAVPGRPGWHIECSAMADKWLWSEAKSSLGESGLAHPHQFDIHGGGIDLVFPHHENEVAQTCSAFGHKVMANYWMHNGFLQVERQKMSKSLGNFVTIRELLHTDVFGGRSWPGAVLRLAMLKTHYRQPIDWTVSALEEAEKTLKSWSAVWDASHLHATMPNDAVHRLSDDLNTPSLISWIHAVHNVAALGDKHASQTLTRTLRSLGFQGLSSWNEGTVALGDAERAQIGELIAARNAARAAKNFAEADRIRDELAAMGVALNDNKDGTTTWEVKR
jgi:cysteinyl-tRNA synthetase